MLIYCDLFEKVSKLISVEVYSEYKSRLRKIFFDVKKACQTNLKLKLTIVINFLPIRLRLHAGQAPT